MSTRGFQTLSGKAVALARSLFPRRVPVAGRRVKAKTRGLAWLGVFAIALQCLVIQPHLHANDAVAGGLPIIELSLEHVLAEHAAEASDHGPIPAHRHGVPGHCSLCQAALAGAAILSSPPVLAFSEGSLSTGNPRAFEIDAPHARRSHNWQGRAPPFQL